MKRLIALVLPTLLTAEDLNLPIVAPCSKTKETCNPQVSKPLTSDNLPLLRLGDRPIAAGAQNHIREGLSQSASRAGHQGSQLNRSGQTQVAGMGEEVGPALFKLTISSREEVRERRSRHHGNRARALIELEALRRIIAGVTGVQAERIGKFSDRVHRKVKRRISRGEG